MYNVVLSNKRKYCQNAQNRQPASYCTKTPGKRCEELRTKNIHNEIPYFRESLRSQAAWKVDLTPSCIVFPVHRGIPHGAWQEWRPGGKAFRYRVSPHTCDVHSWVDCSFSVLFFVFYSSVFQTCVLAGFSGYVKYVRTQPDIWIQRFLVLLTK